MSRPRGALLSLLVLGLAAVAFAPSGQTQAPAAPEPEEGAIYLTPERLSDAGDITCPSRVPRYSMTKNASSVEPAEIVLGEDYLLTGCPTRFLFPVTSVFKLGSQVNLTIHVRCDPVAIDALVVKARAVLTKNPDVREPIPIPNATQPALQEADTDATCLGSIRITIQVPADNLAFVPGDTLALFLVVRATDPIPAVLPMVRLVTGGENASRLHDRQLPPSDAVAMPFVDERASLFWSGDVVDQSLTPCGDVSIYAAMLSVPAPGKAAAELASPGYSCFTRFRYVAETNLSLAGLVTVRFWYACDSQTMGSQHTFNIRITSANSNDVWIDLWTGSTGDLAVCPTSPTFVQVAGYLEQHQLGAGEDLEIRVAAYQLNEAAVASPLQYLVGGQYPSSAAIQGLGATTAPPGGPADAGTVHTTSHIQVGLLVVALAAGIVCRRGPAPR